MAEHPRRSKTDGRAQWLSAAAGKRLMAGLSLRHVALRFCCFWWVVPKLLPMSMCGSHRKDRCFQSVLFVFAGEGKPTGYHQPHAPFPTKVWHEMKSLDASFKNGDVQNVVVVLRTKRNRQRLWLLLEIPRYTEAGQPAVRQATTTQHWVPPSTSVSSHFCAWRQPAGRIPVAVDAMPHPPPLRAALADTSPQRAAVTHGGQVGAMWG